MRRHAVIFILAIFLPSLVLGWLALRTAGKQRILIERQAADLHQAETDAIAAGLRESLDTRQRTFVDAVRTLVGRDGAAALAENFGPLLAGTWPDGGIPFAISPGGKLAYPSAARARGERKTDTFLVNNAAFLTNARAEEVYQSLPVQKQAEVTGSYDKLAGLTRTAAKDKAAQPAAAAKIGETKTQLAKEAPRQTDSKMEDSAKPAAQAPQPNRIIIPQNAPQEAQLAAPSKVMPEISDFQTAMAGAAQGTLARFVQNELQVIFWTKPDPSANWLFGLALGPDDLAQIVRDAAPVNTDTGTVLAVLDDRARPVTTSPVGATVDWKRPFVATEIGEVLPHWEAALYLSNPGQLTESARLITLTLTLLIVLALVAILAGGYVVAADTRRQIELARKKTDFVSNVSHELKTPLTSIRMFAELLAGDRVNDPDKRSRYLRIIAGESERLTRLVNNVLDFARLEKKRKAYDLRAIDLVPLVAGIWESENLRLKESGFQTEFLCGPGACIVRCDADAVVQVLVNLLSNAEKYCGSAKAIGLELSTSGPLAMLTVSDRGTGIRPGLEEKIFEAFYRADDSLASGIQGSGLGLTLARRIARDLGGDLTCRQRSGGGSRFVLTLPLAGEPTP